MDVNELMAYKPSQAPKRPAAQVLTFTDAAIMIYVIDEITTT